MKLILASQSPRRRELLTQLGVTFEIDAASMHESPCAGESAATMAQRLALAKAEAVAVRHPDAAVLGSDTVVALHETIFGQPKDDADACAMLRVLSGATHQVITAVAIVLQRASVVYRTTEIAHVTFRALTDAEISAYVATGEPRDKAGAYAIQGGAASFVEAVKGDYYAVVGLPLKATARLLKRAGVA